MRIFGDRLRRPLPRFEKKVARSAPVIPHKTRNTFLKFNFFWDSYVSNAFQNNKASTENATSRNVQETFHNFKCFLVQPPVRMKALRSSRVSVRIDTSTRRFICLSRASPVRIHLVHERVTVTWFSHEVEQDVDDTPAATGCDVCIGMPVISWMFMTCCCCDYC